MKIRINERIKSYYEKLSKKRKIQLAISLILTAMIIASIPVLAWFSKQRKMAVLSNINAPYTLYLSAGNQESVVYLDMSSIDVGTPGSRITTHKDYVFSVQGSWDISEYYLQLAHTTNIPFKYTVYRVDNNDIRSESAYEDLSADLKATSVPYTTHNDNEGVVKGQTIYYTYRTNSTYTYSANQFGKVMDADNYVNHAGEQLAVKSSSNTYYSQTYEETNTSKVQKNAVPLYMQAGPIKRNANISNGQDFCDYYVLRVDWADAPSLRNEKETDEVYITVVSPSVARSS